MTVTRASLQKTLRSAFNTEFECAEMDPGACKYSIWPSLLDKASGFAIDSYRPYKNTCKSSVHLGTFSRGLVERWFESPGNMEQAFAFPGQVSDRIALDVRVGGKPVESAQAFIACKDANWVDSGVSVRFAMRDVEESELDCCYYLVSIAALGFSLYASGMISDAGPEGEVEGDRRITQLTRYERSAANRARCIAYHGARCAVCGFDFGEAYGDFAKGFIEVHHKNPLSEMAVPAPVDPVNDLVPLCPNCHAAVHLRNPPIDPNVLRSAISKEPQLP